MDGMTLTDELFNLVSRLQTAGIEYALCGGLAMAVHGYPRATMDIDLLIPETGLQAVRQIARDSGFVLEAGELHFHDGQIRLYRLSKLRDTDHEPIPLDLLLVTPTLAKIWAGRTSIPTARGPVWVLSRESLADMKALRGSGRDQDDIRQLRESGYGG